MTDSNNSSTSTEQNNWKIASLVLGLLFVFALVFGGMFYGKYNKSKLQATDLGTQLDLTRTSLEGELASLNVSYTDQINTNDTLSADLQQKIVEVEDLQKRIAKARKDLTSSRANASQIQARLAQMEELKLALELDVISLKEKNQSLVVSNSDLNTELKYTKEEVGSLNKRVMSLTQANDKLTNRLKIVAPAGFIADNFTVTSANKRDKLTTKGKQIDEITVTFDLNNIPLEFQGNREIYLVLSEFNGNPVSAVPSQEINLRFGDQPIQFRAADREKITLKTRQSLTMSFEPIENLTPGTYNLMVYADSGYLGSTGFMVSK